jgi:hypothetical protein
MTRYTPPPAHPTTPDCSICGASTYLEEDEFCCEHCEIAWPVKDFHLANGRWMDEDAEQCEATREVAEHDQELDWPSCQDRALIAAARANWTGYDASCLRGLVRVATAVAS